MSLNSNEPQKELQGPAPTIAGGTLETPEKQSIREMMNKLDESECRFLGYTKSGYRTQKFLKSELTSLEGMAIVLGVLIGFKAAKEVDAHRLAKVLRDAKDDFVTQRFGGPVLMAEISDWLERRATEIEGGK